MHKYFWLATSTSVDLCQATSTSGKFYVGIAKRVVLLAIPVTQLLPIPRKWGHLVSGDFQKKKNC